MREQEYIMAARIRHLISLSRECYQGMGESRARSYKMDGNEDGEDWVKIERDEGREEC